MTIAISQQTGFTQGGQRAVAIAGSTPARTPLNEDNANQSDIPLPLIILSYLHASIPSDEIKLPSLWMQTILRSAAPNPSAFARQSCSLFQKLALLPLQRRQLPGFLISLETQSTTITGVSNVSWSYVSRRRDLTKLPRATIDR